MYQDSIMFSHCCAVLHPTRASTGDTCYFLYCGYVGSVCTWLEVCSLDSSVYAYDSMQFMCENVHLFAMIDVDRLSSVTPP